MKVLAIICLILVVLLPNVISKDVNDLSNTQIGQGGTYYLFPRIDVSCPLTGNAQISNYFFDGQKCEICQDHCKCQSYLGCDTCDDGYGKIYVAHSDSANALNSATCYSCGADSDRIKDCCFQVVTNGSYTMDATNKRVHNFITHSAKAKRAVTCYEGYGEFTNSKGVKEYQTKVMRAGSVCHHISHCHSYTPYGTCTQCREGYFLDSDMQCKQCGSGYNGNIQVLDLCIKCNGPADCQQCAPGYYQPTLVYNNENKNTDINVTTLEKQPSYCQKCSENCICIESNKCTACLTTVGYHYNSSEKTCNKCTGTGCIKCNQDKVCTGCAKGYQLIGTTCTKCDDNCNVDSCIKFKEGDVEKVGCSAQGCHNGYVYNELTKKCFSCDNQVKEYARCSLNPKQEKGKAPVDMIPTQCRQDKITTSETTHDQWSVLFNRLPFENSYFLINQGGNNICLANKYKCKKMDTNIAATKESKCTECYTEFGYHKTTTNECVLCQIDFCIAHTLKSDKCSCTSCITGRNQTQDYRSSSNTDSESTNLLLNYKETTTGTCQQCNVGCVACDASGVCKDNCQLGYRSEGSECIVCTALNCKSCSAKAETCTACFDGYRLWTTSEVTTGDAVSTNTPQCERCDPGCSICQADVKICTKCQSGFYLLDNICRENKLNCSTHNDDGTCQYCEYGYRNVQGICLLCSHSTASNQGYFNCPDGCSSQSRYIRDGDILTEQYYNTRMEEKYKPLNSQIINFVATIFVALIVALL